MSKLWSWIRSLFSGDRIGVIWRTMFTAAKSTVAQMVSDPKNQQKAFDLARDLMGSGKSNEEKKQMFNAALKAWAKDAGVALTDAAINALRENAVVALKCEDCCDSCTK